MKTQEWFDVSKEGLRELQEGKPKHFIVRELVQNAWDEDTQLCSVTTELVDGLCTVIVEDDSPEGFKNIADAFTLFAPTSKRANPEKRGRFNLGEKQAIAMCEYAQIKTTKGTITFSKDGRNRTDTKRPAGSEISVTFKCTLKEYDEMQDVLALYITPKNMSFKVNGQQLWPSNRFPITSGEPILPTEFEQDGKIRPTKRKTQIDIYKLPEKQYLFEMGIPVMEIACKYSVNIFQKVPLSPDRDLVSEKYLKNVYPEILNLMFQEIKEQESGDAWIRIATSNKGRVQKDAVCHIVKERYGDKVVVANVRDKSSIDDAIAAGYRVVSGNELSKEEWDAIRGAGAMQSSSEMFGVDFTKAKEIEPTPGMDAVTELVKKIADDCLGIEVDVRYVESDAGVYADYSSESGWLTFNVTAVGSKWFDRLSPKMISTIVHELAHHNGMHTERSYLDTITDMTGMLVVRALDQPLYFTFKLKEM